MCVKLRQQGCGIIKIQNYVIPLRSDQRLQLCRSTSPIKHLKARLRLSLNKHCFKHCSSITRHHALLSKLRFLDDLGHFGFISRTWSLCFCSLFI